MSRWSSDAMRHRAALHIAAQQRLDQGEDDFEMWADEMWDFWRAGSDA